MSAITEDKIRRIILRINHPNVMLVLLDILDHKTPPQIIGHLKRKNHCGYQAAEIIHQASMEEIEECVLRFDP